MQQQDIVHDTRLIGPGIFPMMQRWPIVVSPASGQNPDNRRLRTIEADEPSPQPQRLQLQYEAQSTRWLHSKLEHSFISLNSLTHSIGAKRNRKRHFLSTSTWLDHFILFHYA